MFAGSAATLDLTRQQDAVVEAAESFDKQACPRVA
jgi:hypothetical protein